MWNNKLLTQTTIQYTFNQLNFLSCDCDLTRDKIFEIKILLGQKKSVPKSYSIVCQNGKNIELA